METVLNVYEGRRLTNHGLSDGGDCENISTGNECVSLDEANIQLQKLPSILAVLICPRASSSEMIGSDSKVSAERSMMLMIFEDRRAPARA